MAYLPILPKSWYKNDTLLCSWWCDTGFEPTLLKGILLSTG